ncbi:Hypothetical predicted protein, partial [Paramuricea clavata]
MVHSVEYRRKLRNSRKKRKRAERSIARFKVKGEAEKRSECFLIMGKSSPFCALVLRITILVQKVLT